MLIGVGVAAVILGLDIPVHHPPKALDACGSSVGLPDGQMGNSEVGHMTLGSGMVVRQDLVMVNDAIEDAEKKLIAECETAGHRCSVALGQPAATIHPMRRPGRRPCWDM